MKITDEQKRFLVEMRKLKLGIIENVVAEEKLFIYGTKVFEKVDKKHNDLIKSLVEIGLLIKKKEADTFYHYSYFLNPMHKDFIKELRLTKPTNIIY